jgi:hypothetical protein
MADFTYQGAHSVPVSGKMASVANWIGAAVSLGLIVGIGVWGYGVVSRDVSGVPIVQAMAGPMRVAPDDPGGRLADHQGLAVNAVAGQGGAADPVDTLRLAPRPAGLQADDVALGSLVPVTETPEFQASLARNAEVMEIAPTPKATNSLLALTEQIGAQSKPLSPLAPQTQEAVAAALARTLPPSTPPGAAPVAEPARYTGPGLARSLRPKLRPAGLANAPRTPHSVTSAAPTVTEVDPETLPAGTRLVQIGAFDSPDAARSEWQRLDVRFGDYLDGKERVIQRATSGGRIFYRLRAHGFDDLSDARRFCAAFVARNVDCIPVVTR